MSDTELLKAILEGGIAEDKALDFIYNSPVYRNGAQKIYRTFSNIFTFWASTDTNVEKL